MNQTSITDSFSVLSQIPECKLKSHIQEILATEEKESQITFKINNDDCLFSIFLVTTNSRENYWNMYVFFMDQIEQRHDTYRFYSFSNLEALHLHSFFSLLITNKK
ncbi:hypothetical protein [Paenibacillus jiagnxiensis]|uniref:hypothetical protein n=1 Tax=Paenibacillus jiagnxiensis TaxID=3228926 RepID=UPI0033B30155